MACVRLRSLNSIEWQIFEMDITKQNNNLYRNLIAYRKAVVIYDLTYHFCERFISIGDRTKDQMIQAARSGKQNIVEGKAASLTSAETHLNLLGVARSSFQELLEDYIDYLRTRNLRIWRLYCYTKRMCYCASISRNKSSALLMKAVSKSP